MLKSCVCLLNTVAEMENNQANLEEERLGQYHRTVSWAPELPFLSLPFCLFLCCFPIIHLTVKTLFSPFFSCGVPFCFYELLL